LLEADKEKGNNMKIFLNILGGLLLLGGIG